MIWALIRCAKPPEIVEFKKITGSSISQWKGKAAGAANFPDQKALGYGEQSFKTIKDVVDDHFGGIPVKWKIV